VKTTFKMGIAGAENTREKLSDLILKQVLTYDYMSGETLQPTHSEKSGLIRLVLLSGTQKVLV